MPGVALGVLGVALGVLEALGVLGAVLDVLPDAPLEGGVPDGALEVLGELGAEEDAGALSALAAGF